MRTTCRTGTPARHTVFDGQECPSYLSRHGVVTLEAIVGVPILVIVLMAGFEYGLIMIMHQAVMSAVTEAAREGAKVPTTVGAVDGARVLNGVESAVETVLGTHGLTVDVASGVQVVVEDSSGVGSRGQAIDQRDLPFALKRAAGVEIRVPGYEETFSGRPHSGGRHVVMCEPDCK